jgi:hypothetical protein
MRPKFITAMYFEGRILLFEEHGDVYEYDPRRPSWTLLSASPWPEGYPPKEPAELK